MACFRKSRTIRSEYVPGTGGHRRMFVRLKGAFVSQSNFSDAGYIAGESAIVIQWEGEPYYDSGYHAEMFPVTTQGLQEAHTWMNSKQTEEN